MSWHKSAVIAIAAITIARPAIVSNTTSSDFLLSIGGLLNSTIASIDAIRARGNPEVVLIGFLFPRYENHAGRRDGVVRVQAVVAVKLLDDQAVSPEHTLEVVQRELGDALHVGERRTGEALDHDSLEEVAGIGPARESIDHAVDLPGLVGRQPRLGVTDVQIIEHEASAGTQGRGHVPHDRAMFARLF